MAYRNLPLAVAAMVLLTLAATANASTVPTKAYLPKSKLVVFPDVTATSYSKIEGACVSIEFGYQPGLDLLTFEYKDTGITSKWNAKTGVLSMHGRESTQAYVDAIRSVTFSTKAVDGKARQVSWNFGENTIFLTDTGHFYTMFERSGLMWEDAVKVCGQTKFFGMTGYLATITSEHEYEDIVSRFDQDVWIGASDVKTPGTWRWVTGPEGKEGSNATGWGRAFWQGLSSFAGGVPIQGASAMWARFQPENADHYLSLRFKATGMGFYNNDMNGIQEGYICEYGGIDSAEVSATAKYYEGSATLVPGCSLLSQDACQNSKNLGCAWSAAGCALSTCLAFKTEKDCEAQYQCFFNSDASPSICENTICSMYKNADSCNADSRCNANVLGDTIQCVHSSCDDLSASPSQCNSVEGDKPGDASPCMYLFDKKRCVANAAADCSASGMDVAILVDGSAGMGDTFGRHSDGFVALMDITKEFAHHAPLGPSTDNTYGMRFSIIQFGPAAPVYKSLLSADYKTIAGNTLYQEEHFADNAAPALITDALKVAVGSFAATGSRKKIVVIVSQGAIADADAAKTYLALNPTVLTFGITMRRQEGRDGRDAAAEASLLKIVMSPANYANIIINSYADTLATLCDIQSPFGKELANPKSQFCGRYVTKATCDPLKQCGWDFSASSCITSHCTLYADNAACVADPVCSVDASGTGCTRTVCPTAAPCGASCDSSNGGCAPKLCYTNPTEDSCAADPAGCVFNPANKQKCMKKTCFSADQTVCIADTTCAWNGDKCYVDLCKAATGTDAKCNAQPQCVLVGGTCKETICAPIVDEKKCDEHYACGWNIKVVPAVCSPNNCGYKNVNDATAKAECDKDAKCYWETIEENKVKSQCIDRTCKTQKSSCTCATLPNCVWRDQQCRENRFVQCPAIDIVFLIQGSPVMTKTFGRHPNGFAAVIQSLRKWSREAPLTTDPNAAGFRVATVQFGPETIPGVVSRDVGGGGNVTGDVFKVIAELEWHDRNLLSKDNTKDEMNLQPSLQKASDILMNSPKSKTIKRTKIIIVLGHSPIADGTAIASVVDKLNKADVQIFSNQIRRFDAVTDYDKNVGSMLYPLASDPQESHFLYATVDNIDDLLLQKFCDPTTHVGHALHISKSGDIPCGWLPSKAECGGQSFCEWNPLAVPTCPEMTQCPNLDCQEIPKALLDKGFTCSKCKLTNGALECTMGSTAGTPMAGGCVVSTCTKACEATCGSSATCNFDTVRSLCQRSMCTALDTIDTCNADYGCSWNPSTLKCVVNTCGSNREILACDAQTVKDLANVNRCEWVTPLGGGAPLCRDQECPFFGMALPQECKAWGKDKCEEDPGMGCIPARCNYHPTSACDDACVMSLCAADTQCYYDPSASRTPPVVGKTGACILKKEDCVMSNWSQTSECSASCGKRSITERRSILQLPMEGGVACPTGPTDLVRQGKCLDSEDALRLTCAKFCMEGHATEAICLKENSCYWSQSGCQSKDVGACQNKDICTDGCKLVGGMCVDDMTVCNYDDPETCAKLSCSWVEKKGTFDSILYNPGDNPQSLFLRVSLTDPLATEVTGAVVYIQDNYQRGKDVLIASKSSLTITSHWSESAGALYLSGKATVEEYGASIRGVQFFTSSTSQKLRTVSWSLGDKTFYHSGSDHFYKYIPLVSQGWLQAKTTCSADTLLNTYKGYLATIASAAESQLITAKLEGHGWIAGSDSTEEGVWKWIGGPEDGIDFWQGGPGGSVKNDLFANWEPPTVENQQGEPSNTGDVGVAGEDFLYVLKNGFWSDKSASAVADGFICEYKGLTSDSAPQFQMGGFATIAMAGCFPETCTWHTTASSCVGDLECMYTKGGECAVACASLSSQSDCGTRAAVCRWDTETLPPVCSIDMCGPLGATACAAQGICAWDGLGGRCIYRTGCERNTQSECAGPTASVQCYFDASANLCMTKGCDTYLDMDTCGKQAMCSWKTKCIKKNCEHIDDKACDADSKCNWLKASDGFLSLLPGGSVVAPFAGMTGRLLADDSNINVDGATVSIAEGFEDTDKLSCDKCPAHLVDVNFDSPTLNIRVKRVVDRNGKETKVNAVEMYRYVQLVQFSTKSNSPRRRTISYALGVSMAYIAPNLASSGYYFKALTTQASTVQAARDLCAGQSYFGLKGYLAAVTSERDTIAIKLLKGKGIISATDAAGVWSWDTATAFAAKKFWSGYGSLGSPVEKSYAQWELGQPNGPLASPSVAYLLSSGKWISIIPTSSTGIGVICRFGDGSSTGQLDRAGGSRGLQPSGCFPRVCAQLVVESECRHNYLCDWRDSQCVSDGRCGMQSSPSSCNTILNCFWDYEQSSCIPGGRTMCNELDTETYCADPYFASSCAWDMTLKPNACTPKGCSKYPFKSVCANDPMCRWLTADTLCVARLCGYTKEDECWSDKLCIFNHLAPIKTCAQNPCYNLALTACTGRCSWNVSTCVFNRCQGVDAANCAKDPVCMTSAAGCSKPPCANPELMSQKACDSHPECYFDGQAKTCTTDQCTMNKDEKSCSGTPDLTTCMWDKGMCRHKTVVELLAPSDSNLICPVHEEDINMWWLWLLLVLIIIGLCGVMWRLYLAYKHGYSFTDPSRYNKKFSAQEMYAKDLEDMTGDEVRTDNDADAGISGGLLAGAHSPSPAGDVRPSVDDL